MSNSVNLYGNLYGHYDSEAEAAVRRAAPGGLRMPGSLREGVAFCPSTAVFRCPSPMLASTRSCPTTRCAISSAA
jgi:hypothetical protein